MDEKKLKPKMGRRLYDVSFLDLDEVLSSSPDTLQTDHLCGFLGDREVVEYKMNKQQPSSQKRKWKEDRFHELERGHPPLSWARVHAFAVLGKKSFVGILKRKCTLQVSMGAARASEAGPTSLPSLTAMNC